MAPARNADFSVPSYPHHTTPDAASAVVQEAAHRNSDVQPSVVASLDLQNMLAVVPGRSSRIAAVVVVVVSSQLADSTATVAPLVVVAVYRQWVVRPS